MLPNARKTKKMVIFFLNLKKYFTFLIINSYFISHFLLIHIRIYIVRRTIFFTNHDMIDGQS